MAALEAMAARTPVISTNSGGLSEVNIDGVTGYLSDVGDTDAMAKNGIAILKNPETLQEFKTNALAQAKEFSLENVLPSYKEIYREVIKGCC